MMTSSADSAPRGVGVKSSQQGLMLLLATIGFAINFWAWALLSPLGAAYKIQFSLSSVQQAMLVATPVLIGAVGRIPVGALTDRFGARVMFPLVSLVTIAPILYIGHFGHSFLRVIIAGFFLGIAGTVFAVGVPFVNAWFPPARRGFAIGLFGIGMGGTAISALTTVRLTNAQGQHFPFDLVAILLALFGVAAALLIRDNPDRPTVAGGVWSRTGAAVKLKTTWEMSGLYAVGFGGFVAFSVYLPTFLKNAYLLTPVDAANRAAGFVLAAVVLRPIGGWLSDRFDPVPVLVGCFTVVTLGAVVISTHLKLMPGGTIVFLIMASALGAAAGACFALVARVAPPTQVGAVTGIVGAAGGLGGFIPPLVMGAVFGWTGSYAIGFLLLGLVALTATLYTRLVVRPNYLWASVNAPAA